VEGALPSAGCDDFVLYASYTFQDALKFAFGYADYGGQCFGSSDIPKYTLPFRLFHIVDSQEQLVYRYVPKTPMPDWGIYKLILPNDPYKRCWYLFYSKNYQTAIKEAYKHARFCYILYDGWDTVPEGYIPKPYQVLIDDTVIYDYIPPDDVVFNPKYLVTDPNFRYKSV
jgi:hypothetical protein